MGFFQTFWTWLDAQLAQYIGANLARVAEVLEPAIVTLLTVYVMVWGYLQMTGAIQEPFVQGLKRILTVAVVLGVSLRLWLYNAVIVNTFYQAPADFAAAIVGTTDPVHTIDRIWDRGGSVAGFLFNAGSGWTEHMAYPVVAIIVWILTGLVCVYTMFLIALSHVALAVLLALGPLFFAMVPLEATRRLFDAWLAQLTNYALVTVLTILSSTLLLQIVESFATQTAGLGTGLKVVDVLNMLLVCVLVLLLMRQVMPIASGLASGASINTFGTVSRTLGWHGRAVTALARRPVSRLAAVLVGQREQK